MIRRAWLWIWIVGLFVAATTMPTATSQPATTSSSATTTATSTAPTTSTTSAPAPIVEPAAERKAVAGPTTAESEIDLTNIATHAETVKLSLRRIEADAKGDRLTPAVIAQLPAVIAEIDTRLDESYSLLQSQASLGSLEAVEQDWTTINLELDGWNHGMEHQQQALLAQIGKGGNLNRVAEPWYQGRSVAAFWVRYGTSPGFRALMMDDVAKMDSVLNEIDRVRTSLRDQLLLVAKTRTEVDFQTARTLSLLDSIHRAREAQIEQLFHRNSPMIWQLHGWTDPKLFEQANTSFERQIRAVWVYLNRRRDRVGFQALVAVALSIGLFWARRRVQQWAKDDPNLLAAKPAFSSPLATAMVLSFVVGVWLYPQAPRLFWAAVGALALVPTVVILRRLIERRMFAVLDALVVFYFVDQVRTVVAAIPLMARALFLAEMLAATGLMISIVFTRNPGPTPTRFAKLVHFSLRIWLAVLVLVVIANAVGYATLSELVGSAALAGAYLAVIFYAATLVVGGVIVIVIRSRPIVMLQMIKRFQPLILRRIIITLQWLALIGWAISMLEILAARPAAWAFIQSVWNKQAGVGSLRFAPFHVLAFGLTIWFSFLISRFIQFVLCEDIYDRFPMPSGLGYAINRMVHYVVLLGGFYLGVTALGMDISQFTFLSAAFGLGIGFGMQNIFNNFVSGLILLFERPIKVGDVIDLDDTSGVVNHIGIRASIIHTADSSEIIVPNGNLISSRVTNWTLSNRQRGITIPISVGGQSDPTAVMDLFKRVATAHPLVTKYPKPQAYLIKFSQDSFSYELHVWTDVAEQWTQIRSDVSVALHEELSKQNIPIR